MTTRIVTHDHESKNRDSNMNDIEPKKMNKYVVSGFDKVTANQCWRVEKMIYFYTEVSLSLYKKVQQ
jgi:hypothetical protein